jgi:hypothetical protein
LLSFPHPGERIFKLAVQVYAFPERIERAGIVIPDPDSLAALDKISIPHAEIPAFQNRGQSLGLTALHDHVFLLASVGGTTQQVSKVLRHPKPKIIKARNEVNNFFNANKMAVSVYRGLKTDYIEVDSEEYSSIPPTELELKILQGVANGFSNEQLVSRLAEKKHGRGRRQFLNNMHLFWRERLGADGRTHSMRRGFELGILPIRPGHASHSNPIHQEAAA